ncbi:MAG: FHA domain-containing protein [Candidatus Binatia bacterium]
MDAVIVEVHAPGGGIQRVRLTQFPASIGRAYDNDVILDDPYVCPLHLRLARDESGALSAEDAGSVNGVFRETAPRRVARVAITPGLRLRVGHTLLRFCDPQEVVAPALVDRTDGSDAPWLQRPWVALGICAAALGVVGVDAYMSSFDPKPLRGAGSTLLVLCVFALGWATVWAFITRVVSQRWRLLGHTAAVCAFAIGVYAVAVVAEYYGFITSSTTASNVFASLASGLLLAALFNAHLGLASPLPPRRRRVTAALVALLVAGSIEMVGWLAQERFFAGLEFADGLKPVPPQWLPTEPIGTFLAGLDSVMTEVDELAAQEP